MVTAILTTKLYIPNTESKKVSRPQLMARLNAGLQHKLTLISAPAGFGKTSLVSEWVRSSGIPTAWLSLDEEDKDTRRFLTYLIAALQSINPKLGQSSLKLVQAPQLPPIENILTELFYELSRFPSRFILVLDDYHLVDSQIIDHALSFILKHLPPQIHLVIASREDPKIPLGRLRASNQLTELRLAELRFSPDETRSFLNQVMDLKLSMAEATALENRTEGWIAGLQLAAISMRGHPDAGSFIKAFTGGHHFVMDYLVQEVLQQQSEAVQNFLLMTAMLNRLSAGLCEALIANPSISGQAMLEYLERSNLFIIALDNERQWFRYHHLFADLLRQKLHQQLDTLENGQAQLNELHRRASQWYETAGLDLEAFQHSTMANDIERAERLLAGKGIPLHLRGAVTSILNWLDSLPLTVLNMRPWLWLTHASLLLVNGQTKGVEEKLNAAETALAIHSDDERSRNLIGQIAATKATLALTRYQAEIMQRESQRALDYLSPNRLALRANAYWTLGMASVYQKDFVPARQALLEAVALSRSAGEVFPLILASIGLGQVEEGENQNIQATETYRAVLAMAGEQPLQVINEAHIGLARIYYEWNDLAMAETHAWQSLHLARQYDSLIDRFVIAEVFIARLKLAQGEVLNAKAILARTKQAAQERNFVYRFPEISATESRIWLYEGNLQAAQQILENQELPLSQARVLLAMGNTKEALLLLEKSQQAKMGQAEALKVQLLMALAYYQAGAETEALQTLSEALALAEAGGCIRTWLDEGAKMAALLSLAARHAIMPQYLNKLLQAFEAEKERQQKPAEAGLLEPLSPRELEVLGLIAQGRSNQEICQQLILALDTVKGHNRRIFEKLQVQRRTEAVARARELGLV